MVLVAYFGNTDLVKRFPSLLTLFNLNVKLLKKSKSFKRKKRFQNSLTKPSGGGESQGGLSS